MSKVTLESSINTKEKFDFSAKIQAKKVIRQVLILEGCPYDVDVSFTLVDDEEIHEMNRDYRGIDRATDGLSFPGVEYETPSDFSVVEEDPFGYLDPDTGHLMLGDIVLNAKRVKEQAVEYGHSELREFSFLIAHSTLHLCGYDHMTPEEAKEMEEKQEHALQVLGITRD